MGTKSEIARLGEFSHFLKSSFVTILGSFCCILATVFFILSIPIYLFRVFVIYLAKYFRPDFGDNMSGQNTIYVGDYMADTPPRSNNIFVTTFQGHLTLEEVEARVLRNWIIPSSQSDRKSSYEKFQCYPVKWMGFVFWKKSSFSMGKHLIRLSGKDTEITEEELSIIMETMLNKRIPKNQSPWELLLIENFKMKDNLDKPHSVLMIKWHHILTDGTGMTTALTQGLFEHSWEEQFEPPLPKQSLCQNISRWLIFPVLMFFEMSYFFSHAFRASPFKVPDSKKEWHLVCSISNGIPVQRIKDIKNAFGVTYTSVLASAFSAAIHKTLRNCSKKKDTKSMYFLSILKERGLTKREILANHLTAAIFDLPVIAFQNPVERLKVVDKLLQSNIRSVIPLIGQNYSALVGCLSYLFHGVLANNRMIPIGITNFPGSPVSIQLNHNIKWIGTYAIAGGFTGVAGVTVGAISHAQKTVISVCAEGALLSREEANTFCQFINQEIEQLYQLMPY